MSVKSLAMMLACGLGISSGLNAAMIDFEDRTGPDLFANAGPAQTLVYNVDGVTVTFSGGVILRNATNAPANQTSLYGTAYFGDPTLTTPLTVTFSAPITNFFLDVYNGLTSDTMYTVSDNAGNSAAFTLIPNFSSGRSQIGFPAAGTVVTIASGSSTIWDFAIDNVHFNEALPPSLSGVPEPGTYALFGGGLLILTAVRRVQQKARA